MELKFLKGVIAITAIEIKIVSEIKNMILRGFQIKISSSELEKNVSKAVDQVDVSRFIELLG